jgi:uncharacterized protein YndB with AHSA1/START domain
MPSDRIERETLINAPVERVWRLITEAEHIGTWFSDAGAEIDLRPGGQLVLRWEEHGIVRGVVEAVEPPHRFAYRWLLSDDEETPAPTPANSTLVEFTLTAEAGGTRLQVAESGFATLDLPADTRATRYADHETGWGQELGDLVEHAGTVAV